MAYQDFRTNYRKRLAYPPNANTYRATCLFSPQPGEQPLHENATRISPELIFPRHFFASHPRFHYDSVRSHSAPLSKASTKVNHSTDFEPNPFKSLAHERDLSVEEDASTASFVNHAQLCGFCADPYETCRIGSALCADGYSLAQNVARVLFMTRNGDIRSKSDGYKVRMSFGFESARSLLRAIERSKRLSGLPFEVLEKTKSRSLVDKHFPSQRRPPQIPEQRPHASLGNKYEETLAYNERMASDMSREAYHLTAAIKKDRKDDRKERLREGLRGVIESLKNSAYPVKVRKTRDKRESLADLPGTPQDLKIAGPYDDLPIRSFVRTPSTGDFDTPLAPTMSSRSNGLLQWTALIDEYDGDFEDNAYEGNALARSSASNSKAGIVKNFGAVPRKGAQLTFREYEKRKVPYGMPECFQDESINFEIHDDRGEDAIPLQIDGLEISSGTTSFNSKKPSTEVTLDQEAAEVLDGLDGSNQAQKRRRETPYASTTVRPQGKRTREGAQDPGDGEDGSGHDSDDDDSGRPPKRNGRPPTLGPRRRLKCPFYQRQPDKYRRAACKGEGFADISKLKDHIKRVHTQPLRCSRYWEEMKSDEAYSKHLREDKICNKRPQPPDDRVPLHLLKQLDFKKAPYALANDEEKWRKLYSVLFPEDQGIPSPYDEQNIPPGLDSALSKTLEKEFAQLQLAHGRDPILVILQQRIPAIVEKCKSNLRELSSERDLESPPLSSCRQSLDASIEEAGNTPSAQSAPYCSGFTAPTPPETISKATVKKSQQVRFSPSGSTTDDWSDSRHVSSLESIFDTPQLPLRQSSLQTSTSLHNRPSIFTSSTSDSFFGVDDSFLDLERPAMPNRDLFSPFEILHDPGRIKKIHFMSHRIQA